MLVSMYSTRAFAQLAGVTVKTLRHYERVGLLTPKRTRTHYRRYSLSDLRSLNGVLALKSLGLPLRTVKMLMKGEGGALLRSHRETLVEKRARMDRAIAALTQFEQHPHLSDALNCFIAEATWDRWEDERRKRATGAPRPPDRVSASRIEIFRQLESAIAEDATSARARDLAIRCREMIDPETLAALKNRAKWPLGMRRYAASLFDATPESWDRVVEFVETI
jgi:DNA-binding transcriptional MerR regulator